MSNIIELIDEEIARLQQVRSLLSQNTGVASYAAPAKRGRKPGRPAKSTAAPAQKAAKRVLSPSARKAIADAQRRRWAAAKAVPKGTAKKKSAAKKSEKSEVPF